MAKILNIETSSKICSVALSQDGEVICGFESSLSMDHSTSLAPFVEKCLEYLRQHNEQLDAVAVSNGPGSYTGLRIGLSMAKGLAFGFEIPLICISSLEILAVRAIFTYPDFTGEELIVPMIDARRMEVYSCIYDSALNIVQPESAKILDEDSYKDLGNDRKVLFIGDGSEKYKAISNNKNSIWVGYNGPHAKYMPALAEKYYKEKRFADVAYSVPSYLKEYETTQSKKNILQ